MLVENIIDVFQMMAGQYIVIISHEFKNTIAFGTVAEIKPKYGQSEVVNIRREYDVVFVEILG